MTTPISIARCATLVTTLAILVAMPSAAADKSYTLEPLADGVYALTWDVPMVDPIEANNLIVVNDRDVVVVDSSLLPSTARRVIAEVRKLTDKPVRYVVNTHWHDDHVFGNAAWREAYPGVEFIAHANTRQDAIDQAFGALPDGLTRLRTNLERLEGMLESGKGPDGTDLTPDLRTQVEEGIVFLQGFIGDLDGLPTVAPDLTFDHNLVLERGDRTIEIRYLGLGNTKGDIVVFLPSERIVATGDLVVRPTPFGIGSYYEDWSRTLGVLGALEADILVPGHGSPLRGADRSYLGTLQSLLGALLSGVGAAVERGASLDETLAEVTLADFKAELAGDDPVLGRAFDSYFVRPAVERSWRQAMGEPDTTERLK